MKKVKSLNQNILNEVLEEEYVYGKKMERLPSEMRRDRRPLRNLKKAWEEHVEDYDEVDQFYEH